MFDVTKKLADAVAAGFLLRTSEAYKSQEFKGGEMVVSEWGTTGEVVEVLNGRPSRIKVDCSHEGCEAKRIIKSQDFFQVVSCGPDHKKALNKAGLHRTVPTNPNGSKSSGKSDRKLLEQAKEMGLISEEVFTAKMAELDAKKAASQAARTAETAEAKVERIKAQLKARLGIE